MKEDIDIKFIIYNLRKKVRGLEEQKELLIKDKEHQSEECRQNLEKLDALIKEVNDMIDLLLQS